MPSTTETFDTPLCIQDEGGNDLDALTMSIDIAFEAGEPESGRYGPPEFYDPGSGPEIYVESVRLVSLDKSFMRSAKKTDRVWTWAEKWLAANRDFVEGAFDGVEHDAAGRAGCDAYHRARDATADGVRL